MFNGNLLLYLCRVYKHTHVAPLSNSALIRYFNQTVGTFGNQEL